MRNRAWFATTMFTFLAACGIEDGTNLGPEPPTENVGWAAVEMYATAGPNGEWVAVNDAATMANRNWIESLDGDGWDKVLWATTPEGAREPFRPPVPQWVMELRRQNAGEWPWWFGPAERSFYRADEKSEVALSGQRCGDQEELVLFMEAPYSVGVISQSKQGPDRGTVTFVVGAHQETNTIVPPGSERNEARHRMGISGTITGFGRDRTAPGHGVVSPGCQAEFPWFVRGRIPAEQIHTEATLCVETSTYHYADNDYVLWEWDDETWTNQQCTRVCPTSQMDPDGNCTRDY